MKGSVRSRPKKRTSKTRRPIAVERGPLAAAAAGLVLSALALFLLKWYLSALALFAGALFFLDRALPGLAPRWMDPPGNGIRFLPLTLGILAGYFGVWELARPVPGWALGVPLQSLAMALLVSAFPARAPVTPSAARRTEPPAPPSGFPALFLGLLILGGAAAAWAFHRERWDWGLVLLLAAVGMVLGAGWKGKAGRPWTVPVNENLLLAAILVVAALMRFPFVGQFWFFTGLQLDEANHMLDAQAMNEGRILSPFITGWWGNPSLPYAFTAEAFKMFGTGVPTARGLSVVVSLVSAFLFFRLCRRFFGSPASLLATLFFTLSWWNLFYSLSPFTDIFTLLFETAAFLAFARALQEGKRSDYWWGGVLAAASVMSYISGRLVPLMLGTAVLLMILFQGREFLRAQARHLFLSFLGFLWFLGPFLHHILRNPEEHFLGRSKELSIFNEVARTGDWFLPLKTFAWTALSLFWADAGVDERFAVPGIPHLDPFVLVLFAAGLGAALWAFRSRPAHLILPGVLFGLLANSMAIQSADPDPRYTNAQRFFLILPFLYLLTAWGAHWIGGAARSLSAPWKGGLAALAVLCIAGSAWHNGSVYYRGFLEQRDCWALMGFNHLKLVEEARKHKDDRHLMANWSIHNTVGEFMIGKRFPIQVVGDVPIPLKGAFEKDLLFFLQPWGQDKEQEALRRSYPGAEFTMHRDPWDRPVLLAVHIPLEELRRADPDDR